MKRLNSFSSKRALSTIVATLIIILLVLVATGIIWVVVRNVIQEGAEQVSLGKFTLDLELKNVQRIGETNNMSLQVKRNPGAGEFVGLNFIFDDGDNAVIVKQNVSLKELEQKTYTMEVLGINLSNLRKVSIAPVFRLESGKEVVGDVKDFVEFGSGVSVGSGDSNVGADCTVENVASDCGESETVRICYNGDVQDRTSSWSCVDESCEVSETYTVVEQCVSPTDVCSPSTVSCVECLESSDCSDGESCSSGSCVSSTNQFLANGFESGLAHPYLFMNGGGSLSVTNAYAHSGSYSLRVDGTSSSYFYTGPDSESNGIVTSLPGGGPVTYSVYARSDSSVQAGLMIMCLDDQNAYWNYNAYQGVEQVVGSSWTQLSVSYTCPSTTQAVGVRLSVRGSGSVWYDDAVLDTDGGSCTSNSYEACYTDGNVWSFDSCGAPESMVNECGSEEICSMGSCIAQSGDCVSYNGVCGDGCTAQQDHDCFANDIVDWFVFTLKDEYDYANRVYIDPTYTGVEFGTYNNPYDSWTDVNFESNTAYVQKRGTTETVSKELIVSVDNVYFGAYGSGERPRLIATSSNLFSIQSSYILFKGLHMENPSISRANQGAVIDFAKDYGGGHSVIYDCLVTNSGWEGIFIFQPFIKVLNTEVSHIYQDGIWVGRWDFEFAYNNIHDVNEAYYVWGSNSDYAGGDAIQGAYHLYDFRIHNNIVDRSNSGNKFGIILETDEGFLNNGIIEKNYIRGPILGGHGGSALYLRNGGNIIVRENDFQGPSSSSLWLENLDNILIEENSFYDYSIDPDHALIDIISSSNIAINGNFFEDIEGPCVSGSYTASGNTGDCF